MREILFKAQRCDNRKLVEGFLVFYRASQIGIAQINPTILIHQVEGNNYFDKTWINKDNLFWQRVDEFMLQGFF